MSYKCQRIYVDTSVIGGCFDTEFAEWSNKLMADFSARRLIPLLSDIVAAEILDAPEQVRTVYRELSIDAEFITVDTEAIELADAYQAHKILTPKFYEDGLHIALATIAQADVLVSWNFKHIVHFHKIRLFNAVNLACGYKPLEIFSPREVANYDTEAG